MARRKLVTIPLTKAEFNALDSLARAQVRTPIEQAIVIIREAVEREQVPA